MLADHKDGTTSKNPSGCFLTIAWIVGFGCGFVALQLLQHVFFPFPEPMPEELRMDVEHMFAILFVCVCCGFLGVWFTWRIRKYV